ncbi:MAG: hypothetical protein K2Y29_19250 [Beijerinckiaceae bacterium]|nr:hypothetical protein [Beijerinckiaceae bacterium]
MQGGVLAALMFATCASAQTAQSPVQHKPLEKTIGVPHSSRPVPSLAVLNAAGAKLEGGKLVLTGVAPNTIVFADRPVRAAGHETTRQFLMQWDEGKDSFAKVPPNATISVLGANAGEVSDAVVVLKTPKLEGTTLTFDVSVLEGNLSAGGPVAVFIDAFAFRGPAGGGFARVGGVGGAYWHAPVYHGGWYAHPVAPYGVGAGLAAGALIGAAAASAPYYAPPACGYYPYPPCY